MPYAEDTESGTMHNQWRIGKIQNHKDFRIILQKSVRGHGKSDESRVHTRIESEGFLHEEFDIILGSCGASRLLKFFDSDLEDMDFSWSVLDAGLEELRWIQ